MKIIKKARNPNLSGKYFYLKCRIPIPIAEVWDAYVWECDVQSRLVLIPYINEFLDGDITPDDLPYFKYTNGKTQQTVTRRINLPFALHYNLKSYLDRLEIQYAGFMRSLIEYILMKENIL